MLDTIIIILAITISTVYLVYTAIKKYKRISTAPHGSCGHSCEDCPFAKMARDAGMPESCKKKKNSGCGCGCCS